MGGPRAKMNRCPSIDHAYFSFKLGVSLTTNICIVSKKMGLYLVSCDTGRLNLGTPLASIHLLPLIRAYS